MKTLRKLIEHPLDPTLILVPLTHGYFSIIDNEDAYEVGKYNWQLNMGKTNNYARRGYRINGKIYGQLLHQFLYINFNCPSPKTIDHENHNGLDNRRKNLRICNDSENGANRVLNINNKTGFKGVFWHNLTQKFRADIKFHGKKITIGSFDDPKEAAKAYNIKAKELFGEFAYLNFIEGGKKL